MMKDEIVTAILQEMTPVLDQEQLTRLKSVVRVQLCGYDISKKETGLMCADQNGHNYLRVFLDTFRQNGKSEGTIEQYQLHLSRMLSYMGKNVEDIDDDDLIAYMEKYKALRHVSNRYMNNIRLVFNSFFRWLQRKKVIMRNPVDGLEPIKYKQTQWTPEAAPSLFAKVLIPDSGVIPDWEQPLSTNGYKKGDRVRHKSKIWESLVDNNVWEPGVMGTEGQWKEVTE